MVLEAGLIIDTGLLKQLEAGVLLEELRSALGVGRFMSRTLQDTTHCSDAFQMHSSDTKCGPGTLPAMIIGWIIEPGY